MKQYYRMLNKEKRTLGKVYDCMNSWGFLEPFITLPTKHPAIMGIYKITPTVKTMQFQPTSGRRSSTSHGGSSEDFLFG